jgi:hypothetical protein
MIVSTRESAPVAAPVSLTAGGDRRADLEARVRAEPTVQAVLDVFGGEIEDIEEIEPGTRNPEPGTRS